MYEFSRGRRLLEAASLDRSIALLRWGSFWTAIVLPLLHVPVLVAVGLTSTSTPVLFALWITNAVALVLGRRHSPHGRDRSVLEGGDQR